MKKLVALFVGLLIIGISATTVSAEEYEVKKGDTLWDIAKEYNTTVEALINLNGLNSTTIHPKQVLEVNDVEIEYYTVKQGDTLEEISKEHIDENEAVTIPNLKAWNDLSSDLIVTGEELIVNGPANAAKTKATQNTAAANKDSQTSESESSSESTVFNTASTEDSSEKESSEPEIKEEPVQEKTEVQGKTISVEATAYTAYCAGCSGITATGINLKADPNAKVIAVDPNVIPLGTRVYVEGYGHAIAGDTGGAIKGNKIDVHVPTKDEAFNWGRRVVEVTIVE